MKGGACCTVSTCRNSTSKKGIKFFRFPNPREPERSRRWIVACNRKDLLDKDPYYLYKNRRICSAHFPESMYLNDLRNRLTSTAEPTLNLGFPAPSVSTLDEGIQWTNKPNVIKKTKRLGSKENYFNFIPKARVVNSENSTSTLLDIDLLSYNLNEHPSVENLPKICRVCFKEDDEVQDIFHLKFDKLFLSEIVQQHTTVELRQGGIIPHKMCIPCIEELTKSYLFFKKFRNADKVLNEIAFKKSPDTDKALNEIALKDNMIINFDKSLPSQNHDDSLELSLDYDSNIGSSCTDLMENELIENTNVDQKFEIEIIDDDLYENSMNFNVMSNFNEHIDLSEQIVTFNNDFVIDLDEEPIGQVDVSEALVFDDSEGQEVATFEEDNDDQERISSSGCSSQDIQDIERIMLKDLQMKLQCSDCNKCFSSSDSLKNHTRKHQNPRRVTCYQCNKTYSSKTALRTHFLTHTGEKPFRCEFCGIQCRQYSHYMTHRRTHTGEKPFSCQYCSVSFASTGLLDMHVRKKHTNQPICTCSDCGQGFFEKRMLKKHRAAKHGDGDITLAEQFPLMDSSDFIIPKNDFDEAVARFADLS